MPPKTRPPDLHSLSDPRAGEGVPLQPLLDPAATHRDSPRSLPDRATDKDLVPEPAHEAEEGAARRQGNKRTGESALPGIWIKLN